jgi:hypothetical protein
MRFGESGVEVLGRHACLEADAHDCAAKPQMMIGDAFESDGNLRSLAMPPAASITWSCEWIH